MIRFCVAIAAAVLGMTSVYAKEVDLTDHDRLELRKRADSLRSSDMLGRDRAMHERMTDRHVNKMRHTKKHAKRKHARRGRT